MKAITYGFYNTDFGEMVLAKTDKGLCWLGFMTEGRKGNGLARMKAYFPKATFQLDSQAIEPFAEQVLEAWAKGEEKSIPLDLQGTPFQLSVWKSLRNIPRGKVVRYSDIANDIGAVNAARAVGTAVGSNPVSLIVPCHRVVPAAGGVGNYGWGSDLKEELLKRESQG